MSTSQPSAAPLPPQDQDLKPGEKVPAGGWLGSQSVFDSESRDPKRTLGGVGVSMILHSIVFAALLVTFIKAQDATTDEQPKPEVKMIYLQQPGPGGGGGGSPAPAPPKPMEIPKHTAPPPVPIVMPPPPVPVPEPPKPTLNAPIETNAASVLQATGASSVSLASYGGGGRGGGIGAGTGNGVGEGTGGGFGGGAFRAGSGIIDPTLISNKEPKYTSAAMLAKIQGSVELEAVVMPDGSIGDVRVIKSLDKNFGLDQEAIVAAKQWKFRPGKDRDGKNIAVIVTLILDFRLH